jgi:multidrug efflux pump subunit AcrA (membrane-fusion protein)
MTNKKSILFILFCLVFNSLGHAAIKKAEVIVEAAKQTEIEKKITFPAITKSQKQSTLLAENSGVIRRINKQLGQTVNKGEVIAWIENPDPVYQYKPLAIRSTIAGKLTKSQVLEGGSVEKGMPLFTVTDPNSIVIEVQVPAKDVPLLKIGTKAFFTDETKKEVKLIGLSPSPDVGTLTSQALFEFVHAKDKSIPGVQGFIDYTASSRSLILLPESTIIRRSGKTFIRKVVDGKMKLDEIKIGERFEDQIEITTGLNIGEEFIVRTSQHLKDGEEVQKANNAKPN